MIQNNKHIRRSRKTFKTNKYVYMAVEHTEPMNSIEPNLNIYDEDDSSKARMHKATAICWDVSYFMFRIY